MFALALIQGVAATKCPIDNSILDGKIVRVKLFKHKIDKAFHFLFKALLTRANMNPTAKDIIDFANGIGKNYTRFLKNHEIAPPRGFHPGFFFEVLPVGEQTTKHVMVDLAKYGDMKLCYRAPELVICDKSKDFEPNSINAEDLRDDLSLRKIWNEWCGKGDGKKAWLALTWPSIETFNKQHTCQDWGLAVLRWILKSDSEVAEKLGDPNIKCENKTDNIEAYMDNLKTLVDMCTEVHWQMLYATVLNPKFGQAKL